MATPVIKIKRNNSGSTPTSLVYGELAADISNRKLYIGDSAGSPVLIGDGAFGGGQPGIIQLAFRVQSSNGANNVFQITPTEYQTDQVLDFFFDIKSQTSNCFFAAPIASNGYPSFRRIVPADFASGSANGKYLTSDGANFAWSTPATGAGGNPAGSTGNIQINDSGVFSYISGFTFTQSTASNLNQNIFNIAGYTSATDSQFNIKSINSTSNIGSALQTNIISKNIQTTTSASESAEFAVTYSTISNTKTFTGNIDFHVVSSPLKTTDMPSVGGFLSPGVFYPSAIVISDFDSSGIIPGDKIKFSTSFGNPNNFSSPYAEVGITANTYYTIVAIIRTDFLDSDGFNQYGLMLKNNDKIVAVDVNQTTVTGTTTTVDYGTSSVMNYYVEGSLEPNCIRLTDSVKIATTAPLTANYSNTTHTLTNSGAKANISTTAQSYFDSTTLSLNDRVLVKNQTNTAYNGIYYVSNVGSTGTSGVNWELTRDRQYREAKTFRNLKIYVHNGSTNGGKEFAQNSSTGSGWLLGTSGITFSTGTTPTPHGLKTGDAILLYVNKPFYYFEDFTTPTINSTLMVEPKLYYVGTINANGTNFKIRTSPAGADLPLSKFTPNTTSITTSPTNIYNHAFFRKLPAIQIATTSTTGGESLSTYISNNSEIKYITNCEDDDTQKPTILMKVTDVGSEYDVQLLVSNAFGLTVGDKFLLTQDLNNKYNIDRPAESISSGTVYTITSIDYTKIWGDTTLSYAQGDWYTQNYNNLYPQLGTYAAITLVKDGVSPRTYVNANKGIVFPYQQISSPQNFYSEEILSQEIPYTKLLKNAKIINSYTVGASTFCVLDRYIRFSSAPTSIKFYKTNKNTISNCVINFEPNNSNDLFNTNISYRTFSNIGLYVTTNSKIEIGRKNPLYILNQNSIDSISPSIIDDDNAGIILKRDLSKYNPQNYHYNNSTSNFKMYISTGTNYDENVTSRSLYGNQNAFWVLGAFGLKKYKSATSSDAFTYPPSISDGNSYLRWVKLDSIASGSTLTGGSGINIILPESFAPNQSQLIKLADEVPINTSLTVPLIKGTAGGDLNITTESPDSNIVLAIPQSNTDVVLSTGSIYITSGLDGGDIYVQSAEDVYLTSQNVRISGNLIVDGYIQSGTGFQGDNTDAEEPITGLVMDGGTF